MLAKDEKESISLALQEFGDIKRQEPLSYLFGFLEGYPLERAKPQGLFGRKILSLDGKGTQCDPDKAWFTLVSVDVDAGDVEYFYMFAKTMATWTGVAFGELGYLRKRIEAKSSPEYCSGEFLEQLRSQLLDQDEWKDLERLKLYLLKLCEVAKRKYESDPESGMVLVSEDKAHYLFDSNLLGKFGNRILLVHRNIYAEVEGAKKVRLIEPRVVSRKDAGLFFGKDIESVKPLGLAASVDKFIFCGEYEDFDFNNDVRLKHILQDRRSRFSETLSNYDEAQLVAKLKSSVEMAVKRSKVDYTWIKPCFNPRGTRISFLIPVFGDVDSQTLECVLLVDEVENLWSLRTVLTPEQAWIAARVVSPQHSWLK